MQVAAAKSVALLDALARPAAAALALHEQRGESRQRTGAISGGSRGVGRAALNGATALTCSPDEVTRMTCSPDLNSSP